MLPMKGSELIVILQSVEGEGGRRSIDGGKKQDVAEAGVGDRDQVFGNGSTLDDDEKSGSVTRDHPLHSSGSSVQGDQFPDEIVPGAPFESAA